jgi:ATPase subunit of ABC transporter with duplicated ATPase domains
VSQVETCKLFCSTSHVFTNLLLAASTILHATSSAAQTSDEEHSQAVTVDDEDDNEDHPALQGDDDEGQALPTQEWSLPEPTNVQVRSAQYVSSCVNVRDCPPPRLPEIAVIGRSNVGKSSLINLLTGNRKLAHVSKEPGQNEAAGTATGAQTARDHTCHAALVTRVAHLMQHRPEPNSPVLLSCADMACRQDSLHQPLHHQ